jgi:hypothetical protein
MGVLSQYKDSFSDIHKDKKRAPKRTYFDCEGDYVCEILTLSSGVSKNKKNTQRMNQAWLAANFKVVKINSVGEGADKTQIFEGGKADWHKWLPRGQTAEEMSVKEQFDIAEIHEFGAGVIGMIPDYVTNELVDQLFEDDGRGVSGRLIGVSVDASPGDEKNEDGSTFYFYNVHFYPVDAEGNRIEPMTPDELMSRNAS